jgi:hypothetical protein
MIVGSLVLLVVIVYVIKITFPPPFICPPISGLDPPCTINVVLDTSASMRGYYRGQTEFKDTLSRFAFALDKFKQEPEKPHCPSTIAYQYYDTGSRALVPAAADSTEFNNELLNDTIPSGNESPLQTMLERVVDESSGVPASPAPESRGPKKCPVPPSNSALSILITDSIFSYPDDMVARNREINRENIRMLAQEVGIIFNKAHAQGKSVSLLALKSQFHGTYYNYRNDRSTWGTTPRPYYLWLIGSSANIRAVRGFLQSEGIIPDHALDFVVDPFDPSPKILQYTERKGTWNRYNDENPKRIHIRRPFPDDRNRNADQDINLKKEVGFAVALDLSHLSPDQLSGDDLATHLKIESQSPDLQINNWAIKTRAEIGSRLNPMDREEIPHATHIVLITTDFNFTKTAPLTISIDDAPPSWYIKWSNDNDTLTDQHTLESTFGLRYFVDAIYEAYKLKGPVAKTTILLER